MSDRDVMRQALEALEYRQTGDPDPQIPEQRAIDALRAALAREPAEGAAVPSEPVAWQYAASFWGTEEAIPAALRHLAIPLYTAPPAKREPPDPMDWPLPCDVTVGHGTMRKGVKLRTLVARMKVLYEMATGEKADAVAARSGDEKAALFAKFQAEFRDWKDGA